MFLSEPFNGSVPANSPLFYCPWYKGPIVPCPGSQHSHNRGLSRLIRHNKASLLSPCYLPSSLLAALSNHLTRRQRAIKLFEDLRLFPSLSLFRSHRKCACRCGCVLFQTHTHTHRCTTHTSKHIHTPTCTSTPVSLSLSSVCFSLHPRVLPYLNLSCDISYCR